MKPAIKKQFDRLDADLAALFEVLSKYSDDDLNWKPAPNKWSVMQVMVHLMKAEGYAHQYMTKKLSSGTDQLNNAGMLSYFRQMLLSLFLKSPFKVKAPAAVSGENLPDHSSFWDIVKQWKKQREDLRTFLYEQPDIIYSKEIYKHPVSGRSNIKGMFRFFDLHMKRHRKQIDRILTNYRY